MAFVLHFKGSMHGGRRRNWKFSKHSIYAVDPDVTVHTGSNPCVNQFVRLFPNYLTTNCPNITLIEKIQKNPENIQSGSKIRKIYSLGRKSGSRIPENFVHEIFIKSHFRGGLCYKFFLKNDCNPQKSMFFAFFMFSTFLHKTKLLI